MSFSEIEGLDNEADRADLDLHVELLSRYHLTAAIRQQVFVIQPFQRTFKVTGQRKSTLIDIQFIFRESQRKLHS
jgi:hypothetical protein